MKHALTFFAALLLTAGAGAAEIHVHPGGNLADKDGIMQAKTPAGLAFDQLFINGKRQMMARYPNYDPKILPYGGFSAGAFSNERAARCLKSLPRLCPTCRSNHHSYGSSVGVNPAEKPDQPTRNLMPGITTRATAPFRASKLSGIHSSPLFFIVNFKVYIQ